MKPMSRFSKAAPPTVGSGGSLLTTLSIVTLSLTHMHALVSAQCSLSNPEDKLSAGKP